MWEGMGGEGRGGCVGRETETLRVRESTNGSERVHGCVHFRGGERKRERESSLKISVSCDSKRR